MYVVTSGHKGGGRFEGQTLNLPSAQTPLKRQVDALFKEQNNERPFHMYNRWLPDSQDKWVPFSSDKCVLTGSADQQYALPLSHDKQAPFSTGK